MKQIDNIDFNYFNELPIEEVAEELGIQKNRNGFFKCPCPNHNDSKPSAHFYKSNKAKENNLPHNDRFNCFACGESGSALGLAMVVKYDITPTDYFKNPKNYNKQMISCIKWLEEYFPGGVTWKEVNGNSKQIDDKIPAPPKISFKLLKEIGLNTNPFNSAKYENVPYTERADEIIDKITDRVNEIKEYGASVLRNFPDLDFNASRYILNETMSWTEELEETKDAFMEYRNLIADKEFPIIDFDNMEFDKQMAETALKEAEEADRRREFMGLS